MSSRFLVLLYIIEKTSDCDTDMQECTAELSNTQTGSAMQLPAGGDKLTNAAALTDIPDVNISENKGPLRTFPGIDF